jgi:hypothetical protein
MAVPRPPTVDVRLYRVALRLCPGEFRRDHGDEMACDFEEARGEAAIEGRRAVWILRLLIGIDLLRTLAVQWLRTGLPVIGGIAAVVTFATASGVASVTRLLTARASRAVVDEEAVASILLITIAIAVIVATVVFNLWAHRSRLVRRR